MRKLKILHTCEFYAPSIGGVQEVIKRISEGLAANGHDVTVATTKLPERNFSSLNGVAIREFEISGNSVRGMSGPIESYQNFLIGSDFDVILNYAAQQWTMDAAIPILDKIKAKKVFVPCGFSGLNLPEYGGYFDEMPSVLANYDHLVFLAKSYRDIDFARALGLSNLSVIPNGCAHSEFSIPLSQKEKTKIRRRFGIPKKDSLVLQVGSHTGSKGHRQSISIFNQAEIPNSTLLIIGNTYQRVCALRCQYYSWRSRLRRLIGRRKSKILSKTASREDTVRLYKAADVFLFPSTIECSPIVLFEAAAAGLPFLVTDVGNSREIIEWTQAGELIETSHTEEGLSIANIDSGAEKLRALLADPARRRSMGEAGKDNWLKEFTWERITKLYEDLYLNLVTK